MLTQQQSAAPTISKDKRKWNTAKAVKGVPRPRWLNVTNLPVNLTFIEGGKQVSPNLHQASQIIQLPKITDHRGSLSFIEGARHIPFKIQSACWLNSAATEAEQPGSTYRGQDEFFIAMTGCIAVVVDNGQEKTICCLDRPDFGLFVPNEVSRKIETFSPNATVLILGSQPN